MDASRDGGKPQRTASRRPFRPRPEGAEDRRRASPSELKRPSRRFDDAGGRLAAEAALRRSEENFAALFNLIPGPMALVRVRDARVLEASRSFPEYLGYDRDEVIGRTTLPGDLGFWVDARHRRQYLETMERDGEVVDFETQTRRKDGSIVMVLLSGKRVEFDGEPCVLVDVCELEERDSRGGRRKRAPYRDPLTGLPNRLLLGDRLRQAIGQHQRNGARIAVCSLAFEGGAEVADRFGHEAGNQLLIEAARRLQANVRGGDTVARLGGDEFAVLLSGLSRDDECHAALDRLIGALSAPYALGDGREVELAASIGVTVFPDDAVDPDALLRHADHAMYAARQSGKNRYRLFDARAERRIQARHETLQRLAEALESRQFQLHYQPQVDCRSGRCVGVEALIRWRHPTRGLLPPAEFLPPIEGSELALEVGDWVIDEALSQIARWRRDGLNLNVSVNAFARQLQRPDFVAALAAALDRHPEAERSRLRIEIVETAALNDLDEVRAMIEDCGKLGVTFSLDDFGTGYSTLAHVRHLPVAEIKIDRSFVRQMLTRSEDLAIVDAVIGLGRAFGRSLVAEGVETPAHIARLLALDCDVMQGYALARPMPAGDVPRWISEFRPDPRWLRPVGGVEES